jgi:hypothetical protein
MFSNFIHERLHSPNQPEIKFFNEHIGKSMNNHDDDDDGDDYDDDDDDDIDDDDIEIADDD